MSAPTDVTFEDGFERLETIRDRVNSEEVPVAEMCDLFAEGKGLQSALTDYLDEQKARVEAIERGEGIKAFRVVAPSEPSTEDEDWDDDASAPAGRDFTPTAATDDRDFRPAPSPSPSADDDIPF